MRALADLFDGKILKYTILPLLMSLFFWGIVFYVFSDEIYDLILAYLSYVPFGESLKNVVATIGSGLIIAIFYYILVISTLGVFTSLFIDHIVLRINEKHYNCTPKKPTMKDLIEGIKVSIVSFLIYLVIFMFTFFLLFIPVVNVIYQLFMWSILNKKPLIFDSSYLFLDPKKVEKELGAKIWVIVILTSIVYFIPVLSLFGYTFQLIFVTHTVLNYCKKGR